MWSITRYKNASELSLATNSGNLHQKWRQSQKQKAVFPMVQSVFSTTSVRKEGQKLKAG
jgi:hypothetical protein